MPNAARLRVEPLEDRVTPAGDLDPTFGSGGVVPFSRPDLFALAPAPDGDTFVALPDGVHRLNPDGSPVALFGVGGVAPYPAPATGTRSIAALPDGGVLLLTGSDASFALTKLSPLGVADPTFGTSGTAIVSFGGTAVPKAATVLPDGRIVVAGSLTWESTLEGLPIQAGEMAVTRLTSTGQIDPSFGDAGRVTVAIPLNQFNHAGAAAVSVGPDGRVLLAGFADYAAYRNLTRLPPYTPFWTQFPLLAAVRLLPDGRLDPTFGAGGRITLPPPSGPQGSPGSFTAAQVLDDGRVLLAGSGLAVRLTPAGQIDSTYGFGGRVTELTTAFAGVSIDAQHRVLFLSEFGSGSVSRLTADGAADPTFGGNGIVQYSTLPGLVPAGDLITANVVAPQANGDILLGLGSSPNGNGTRTTRVARLVSVSPPAGFTPPAPGTFVAAGPANGTVQVLTSNGSSFAVASPSVYLPGVGLDYRPTSEMAFIPAAGLPTGSPQVQQSVRPAVADVTGDGTPDYVFAAGPGGPPRVVVLDGATGRVAADFAPFESSFTGGAFAAAADLDRDGRAEVIVTPDQGGGGRVVVYSVAAGGAVTLRASFFGIDDPNFRGGARVAAGDINRDGTPDVIVAAGFGGGPRVAVFGGASVLAGAPARVVNDFFAFPGADAERLRNGAYVAAGDLTGDGYADLIFGGGPGGGPRVLVLSGALVNAGNVAGAQAAPVLSFFFGDANGRGGARVAARDVDGDGRADVAVGSGAGPGAFVRVYLGDQIVHGQLEAYYQFLLFGGAALADGVFVG